MTRISDDDFKVAVRQAATRLDLHLMAARLYLDEVFTATRMASAADVVNPETLCDFRARIDDAFDSLAATVVARSAPARKRGRPRKGSR